MNDKKEIGESIKRIAGTFRENELIFSATVEKVNETSCDIKSGDAILTGVKLQAFDTDNGILIKPVKNSLVIVADLSRGKKRDLRVVLFSEIEETIFNGGNNGGVPVAEKILNNLESIKNYVEKMNQSLPGAFTAILAGQFANGELGAQAYNLSMSGATINLQEIENKKLKH
jgi:hypothetical protein